MIDEGDVLHPPFFNIIDKSMMLTLREDAHCARKENAADAAALGARVRKRTLIENICRNLGDVLRYRYQK